MSDPSSTLLCPHCGDMLEWINERSTSAGALLPPPQEFTLWRYSSLLPDIGNGGIVSLSEGGTPLQYSDRLSELLGIEELFIKNEGRNPTGSFKDRGMSVALTAARSAGRESVVCASTGNTASSMAAYCAKAGMKAFVVVPKGKVAGAKLKQTALYGGTILEVDGNFDMALEMVRDLSWKGGPAIMNSINPMRIEGQKTGAFEVCDQLSSSPDWLIIPVGNGGNITAYWKGFREFRALGAVSSLPRLVAVQAEGASPVVSSINSGQEEVTFEDAPETIATAIRIGKPANWRRAMAAVRESNGAAVKVTDMEIMAARKAVASREGTLVELASASTIAAAIRLREQGAIRRDETVVCVTTGNGLKDVDQSEEPGSISIRNSGDLESILLNGG